MLISFMFIKYSFFFVTLKAMWKTIASLGILLCPKNQTQDNIYKQSPSGIWQYRDCIRKAEFYNVALVTSRGLLGCDTMQSHGRTPVLQRSMLPSLHSTSLLWSWRQHGPPKCQHPTTKLCSVTTQKTSTWIFTTMKALKFAYVG
jgi:hypothetical protein